MKLVIVGYPGSSKLRRASIELIKKYTPFEVYSIEHTDSINLWASFVAQYISTLEDEYIVFALDDYLINKPIDKDVYDFLLAGMEYAVLAKLCDCTDEENESYPVTTQYTIWNRKYLLELLKQVNTPWEFELKGSQIFKESGKRALFGPALHYYTNSALSARWEGVRLDGLNEEDIKTVQKWI